MLLRSVMLFGFLLSFLSVIGQDVLEPFSQIGCPDESVTLRVKDQYSYAKFVINSGEKSIWATSYTSAYLDEEEITVRAFYADDTEDQETYSLSTSVDMCNGLFDHDRVCAGSSISFIIPSYIDSVSAQFQDSEQFEAGTNYLFLGGEVVDILISDIPTTVDYRLYAGGVSSLVKSQRFQPGLAFYESRYYCKEEFVVLESCSGNPNIEWYELSGIAGNNNNTVGDSYEFLIRQSDVVIRVVDPVTNVQDTLTFVYRNRGKVDIIVDTEETCENIRLTFDDEYDKFRVRLFHNTPYLPETYEGNIDLYAPFVFGDEDPIAYLDTLIQTNDFVIDRKNFGFEFFVMVTIEDDGYCQDYDGLLLSIDPLPPNLTMDLPNYVFNSKSVEISIPEDFSVESWRAYNLMNTGYFYNWLYLNLFDHRFLVAEGMGNQIEFENFSHNGLLEIYGTDSSGNCSNYYYLEDSGSSPPKDNFIVGPQNLTNQYLTYQCKDELVTYQSENGENFLVLYGGYNYEITNQFEYEIDYISNWLSFFQFNVNEQMIIAADQVFDDFDSYCVGDLVEIGLCYPIDDFGWNLSDLNNKEIDYQLQDDVLMFTMPNEELNIGGTFSVSISYADIGYPLTKEIEIQPRQNGINTSLLQNVPESFCHIIDIESDLIYDNFTWYVNGEVISNTNEMTYYVDDIYDENLIIRLEVTNDNSCQFYNEVMVTVNPSIPQAELIPLDVALLRCPQDPISLVCPNEFETCRWITLDDKVLSDTYDGPVAKLTEVQGIDAAGCITRQIIDLNIVSAETPIEPCSISGEQVTGGNVITWQSSDDYEKVYIYREDLSFGVFDLIDSINGWNTQYIDDSVDGSIRSYRYKLQYLTFCDETSSLADAEFHKTISLTANLGVSNVVNLIWNDYEGIDYTQVNVMRGSSLDQLSILTTLPRGITSYIDTNPDEDQEFYRIEVINTEDCGDVALPFIASNVINIATEISSVDDEPNRNSLKVFPNPTTHNLNIEIDGSYDSATIIDINGKIVLSQRFGNAFDISHLQSGVYLLTISVDGKQYTERVSKYE